MLICTFCPDAVKVSTMPAGVGYGVAPQSSSKESHKRGATDKQKGAVRLHPPQGSAITTNPNAIKAKRYRKEHAVTHKSKDTKFSGSLRTYSREYVGPTGGQLLNENLGREKFQRKFDRDGTLSMAGPQGTISDPGHSHRSFPSREQPYRAGFGNAPARAKIAA